MHSVSHAAASGWPPPYVLSLGLALGLAFLAAAIPICIVAAVQWRKVRQAELDYLVKQDLAARGFTADEIGRVVAAGRPEGPAAPPAQRV